MTLRILAALLLLAALSGCSSSSSSGIRSLREHVPDVREFLQRFVDTQSSNDEDYFWISPVRKSEGREFADVFWMTGNSIILLDLPTGKFDDPIGYLRYAGKARVDLAKDVVPTPDDLHGSSYLWSSDAVAVTLRECLSGLKVIVRKKNKGNKAPEPTRLPVMPRALSCETEKKHRTENRSPARVTPGRRVAHL